MGIVSMSKVCIATYHNSPEREGGSEGEIKGERKRINSPCLLYGLGSALAPIVKRAFLSSGSISSLGAPGASLTTDGGLLPGL